MKILWAHPATDPGLYYALCSFVSNRIWNEPRAFNNGSALAVADGDLIVGAVIFNNYDPASGVIELHGAADSPTWLTRKVIRVMADYVFGQLRCQAALMRVDPDDKRLGRMLTAAGFERFDVPRLRGRHKADAFYILGDDVWSLNPLGRT